MEFHWCIFHDHSFCESFDEILPLVEAIDIQWLHEGGRSFREKSQLNFFVGKLKDRLISLTRTGIKNEANFLID